MICPRCADEQIEVMAEIAGERCLDGISVPALPLYGAIPNRCAVPAANIIPKRSA